MAMRGPVVIALLVVVGLGCAGNDDRPGIDTYVKPGTLLEKEIKSRIDSFEYSAGVRLVQSQQRLAQIGEPAIPYLLDGLRHPSALTRGSCAYVLGLIRDLRTIPDLERVARKDDVAGVRYEAAASLVALGDNAGWRTLIEGLRDEDIRLRFKCYEMLHAVTKLDFGYAHDAAPEEREAAVKRWEAWLAAKSAD
jgi:hypothetical protein